MKESSQSPLFPLFVLTLALLAPSTYSAGSTPRYAINDPKTYIGSGLVFDYNLYGSKTGFPEYFSQLSEPLLVH